MVLANSGGDGPGFGFRVQNYKKREAVGLSIPYCCIIILPAQQLLQPLPLCICLISGLQACYTRALFPPRGCIRVLQLNLRHDYDYTRVWLNLQRGCSCAHPRGYVYKRAPVQL